MMNKEIIKKNIQQNLLPLTKHFSAENRGLMIKKIIVIALIWILPITIMALIFMNSEGGSTSKAPIFMVVGILAATAAVWKYKPSKVEEVTSDKETLDKSHL